MNVILVALAIVSLHFLKVLLEECNIGMQIDTDNQLSPAVKLVLLIGHILNLLMITIFASCLFDFSDLKVHFKSKAF